MQHLSQCFSSIIVLFSFYFAIATGELISPSTKNMSTSSFTTGVPMHLTYFKILSSDNKQSMYFPLLDTLLIVASKGGG